MFIIANRFVSSDLTYHIAYTFLAHCSPKNDIIPSKKTALPQG